MSFKIIIADEDKITQHLIEKYIQSFEKNIVIHKAYDGQNAYDLTLKQTPNLVIFNWNNPIINGEKFCELLKQNNTINNIPVIAIIGDLNETSQLSILEKNVFHLLKKPINKIDLIASVKSAINFNLAQTEVSIQKQNLDTHIEELNKLSLIVKETDNCVVIISSDGEIEWANDAFRKMYGISLQEFIERFGNNLLEASFSKDSIRQKLDELFESGKSVNYVSHISGINTIVDKWIQTTLTPIFNENNEIEKIVAIETDITKLKQFEHNLRKNNEEMQKLTEQLQQAYEEMQLKNQIILEERKKTERLLEGILPHHIVSQLKNEGQARPRNYKLATIMFTDFQGFTKACKNLEPEQIVKYLDGFFRVFDDIVVEHFIEKIKTIGDAYMCVGGIPLRNRSNPYDVVLAALRVQHFMNNLDIFDPNKELPRWKIRLGIHTGELTAGVVGKIKFAYDVWGDAVNVASRIESNSEAGFVNISGKTYEIIKDFFVCQYRGEIEMKNRGQMPMYYVNRIKEEFSEDDLGIFPNEKFKKFLHNL